MVFYCSEICFYIFEPDIITTTVGIDRINIITTLTKCDKLYAKKVKHVRIERNNNARCIIYLSLSIYFEDRTKWI